MINLTTGGRPLTWAGVARALQDDPAIRDQLTARIAESSHAAVFWECAPVSRATRERPFAFVLEPSPALARAEPDPRPFRAALSGADLVATFENLGGDAWLVAPAAIGDDRSYTHLAAFVRGAPRAQVHALWSAVGAAVERWWAERDAPVWVSTSGLGVRWLHVRLDRRPKYYTHAPFRA